MTHPFAPSLEIIDNIASTYVPGNLLWLRVAMDDNGVRIEYYRNILIHKWLLSAEFVLNNRPSLYLSWPTIIEFQQDGKWVMELRSEVLESAKVTNEQTQHPVPELLVAPNL